VEGELEPRPLGAIRHCPSCTAGLEFRQKIKHILSQWRPDRSTKKGDPTKEEIRKRWEVLLGGGGGGGFRNKTLRNSREWAQARGATERAQKLKSPATGSLDKGLLREATRKSGRKGGFNETRMSPWKKLGQGGVARRQVKNFNSGIRKA